MNNFDEILTAERNEQGEQASTGVPFDKEAWKEKQSQNRETAYGIIDNAVEQVSVDGGKFQQYLDTQSRFDRYSVRNTLLIMEQKPDAVKIGDKGFWREQGFYTRKQERDNPILIVEPSEAFLRDDGKLGQYYNAKEVYDISQTTAKLKQSPPRPRDMSLLLKALIYKRPAEITTVEGFPYEAQYQPDGNEILVQADMELPDVFRSLSKELAHAELADKDENYSYDTADFKAKCVSYMLCKKNGIDTERIDVSTLPEEYANMEAAEIIGELSSIRDTANDISGRMAKVFEQNKPPKEQGQER